MNLGRAEVLLQRFREAGEEEQWRIVSSMTPLDLAALDVWFEFWAHKNQLPPSGEAWRVWLMMAGRGFGKTRAGAEWVHGLANARPGVRIALVGASIADARKVMVEGVSGVLSVAQSYRQRVNWAPSLGRLKWPNGSEAQLFSGDHANGLRGPEHDVAWCASDTGCYRRRGSGRTAAGIPAFLAAARRLLPNRKLAHGSVGRKVTMSRRLHERRLAIHCAT